MSKLRVIIAIDHDIAAELTRCGYKVTKGSKNNRSIHVLATKNCGDLMFQLSSEYDYRNKILKNEITCLKPLPEEKSTFCLKLLNYCAGFEDEAKYLLCPFEHLISCTTVHSLHESRCSLGRSVTLDADCSVENVQDIYVAAASGDVKHIIDPTVFQDMSG